MLNTIVNIPGYRISEKLYNGSRTVVYRGYRETDSLPVVIKLLKNPYPSFSELLSFRNQYTIAKNLNSPLIIQTYSLEPYQNGYALVMEDFGGISLKNHFTSDQTRHTRAAASKLLLITTKVKKQRKTQHFSFDLFSKPQSDRQIFVNKQALMRLVLHLLRICYSY